MPNQLVIAQPFDASALISIGLDGFLTGATSTALHVDGGDRADAAEPADRAVAKLIGDSLAMEVIRRVNLPAFVHFTLRQLLIVNEFRACFPACVTPHRTRTRIYQRMTATSNGDRRPCLMISV